MTDFRKPHITGRIEGFGFDADSIKSITTLLANVDGLLADSIRVSVVDEAEIPGCGISGNVEPNRFVADTAEQVLRAGKFTNTLVYQVNPAEHSVVPTSA